jgi:hypothetical protein
MFARRPLTSGPESATLPAPSPLPMRSSLSWSVVGFFLLATFAWGQGKPGDGKDAKPMKPGEEKMSGKMEKTEAIDKNAPGKKGPAKIVEEARPARDPKPVAGAIDRYVDAALAAARLPVSPQADDAEFLRRVTLDIIGRVPTVDEATDFLQSTDPAKRARWVDELLTSPAYGEHFATMWRELMLPRDNGMKAPREEFTPWLAEQFSRDRGWDRIVTDMLTAEGRLRETPQAGFIMANTEEGEPKADLLADATGRLFWGVQLRCAECHDHPFANWKQADFWGTAAFFSRVRKGYADGKNPSGWTVTEAAPDEPVSQQFSKLMAAPDVRGPAIVIPVIAGKSAGKVVTAKFLGGPETGWSDAGPYRPRFAQWATSGQNPWFGLNTVNRLWAHFFTRGLVMPMDGLNGENQASHPEVLALLHKELVASGFDLKHVIRCLCASRAYQRSSHAVAGNERDEKLYSHRLVKVMRPEVVYSSISIALQPPGRKGGGKGLATDRAQPLPGVSREEFVRFFASRPDENEGSMVNQGIPQFLRLMNSPLLNATETLGARFAKMNASPDGTIGALYLAAYTRRPADAERRAAQEFLAAPGEARDATSGLLWALLNSSEFVTNH